MSGEQFLRSTHTNHEPSSPVQDPEQRSDPPPCARLTRAEHHRVAHDVEANGAEEVPWRRGLHLGLQLWLVCEHNERCVIVAASQQLSPASAQKHCKRSHTYDHERTEPGTGRLYAELLGVWIPAIGQREEGNRTWPLLPARRPDPLNPSTHRAQDNRNTGASLTPFGASTSAPGRHRRWRCGGARGRGLEHLHRRPDGAPITPKAPTAHRAAFCPG